MKQINIRLEDEVVDNFHSFCNRQGVKGYTFLTTIVMAYAMAESITRQLQAEEIGRPQALLEVGKLARQVQTVAKVNGQFTHMLSALTEQFGVTPADLGFTEPAQSK